MMMNQSTEYMLNEEELLQSLSKSKSRIRYNRKQLLEIGQYAISKAKPENLEGIEADVFPVTYLYDKSNDIHHSKYFDRYASKSRGGVKKSSAFFNGSGPQRDGTTSWSKQTSKESDRAPRKSRVEEKTVNTQPLPSRKPRQAAWYEEKISQTQTFESLEPNAEELTKDEMVRKNAFEEFRKQMGKSSNDDNFESSGTGLPSFFGDAPVTDDGLLEALPNDESNFSSMLPNHETNKNYPHSFLGFTTSEVAPSIDSLLNIGGEEDHEEMFAFPFRSKPTESRGASKFFSGLNNAPVEREKNNHALPLQENNLLKKEIEVFDESTFMKEILDQPEKESTKSPVDPLHAIFANSSASSTNSSQTSVANRQINQDKSFPYRQQSTTQNSRVPLEMTDVSSIEQELLKGRGSEPSPTADSATTGNFMQDIFQKFQQPQFDAMRMQQHNGPPHQFSQSPTPQSQYINPYEQYRQSQFLKQQQQQQQQQHTQNQAPQVLEETKNTTQPKSAKKGRANQFVPPQISKSIGKAIKPKKQATPNKQASEQVATEHPAQPTQQQQQQQMPQNFSAQKMLPPHNGMPMNPNYMMQPMHMPTMYNNGNFPQQWFNYVGQQNIPSQTRMMSLPSDALSAEDLERNFMQSRN